MLSFQRLCDDVCHVVFAFDVRQIHGGEQGPHGPQINDIAEQEDVLG